MSDDVSWQPESPTARIAEDAVHARTRANSDGWSNFWNIYWTRVGDCPECSQLNPKFRLSRRDHAAAAGRKIRPAGFDLAFNRQTARRARIRSANPACMRAVVGL